MEMLSVISQLGAKIGTGQIVMYVLLGVMVIALFVFPSITNRRRAKEFNQMMDNLSVGDEILTTAGIIGKIKKINRKQDGLTFLLETGEKTVMEFDVSAIARVLHSVNPPPVAQKSKPKDKKKDAPKTELEKMQEQEAKKESPVSEPEKK